MRKKWKMVWKMKVNVNNSGINFKKSKISTFKKLWISNKARELKGLW